jgi:hypothetical protein
VCKIWDKRTHYSRNDLGIKVCVIFMNTPLYVKLLSCCTSTGESCLQARDAVVAGAPWFVNSYEELLLQLKRNRVAMIGSGAWACAAARMIAQNTQRGQFQDQFVSEVRMWVYQESIEVRNSLL